ncbi:ABC transporter permease subunit [Streptomyces sp. M19]
MSLTNPVVAVALSASPALTLSIYQGTRAMDSELREMAHVYRFSLATKLRYLWLPSLLPALFSGARLGLSLSWKVIVLVEMFGMSSGVGYELNNQFAAQNVAGVLSWTLLFALVMAVLEYGCSRAWNGAWGAGGRGGRMTSPHRTPAAPATGQPYVVLDGVGKVYTSARTGERETVFEDFGLTVRHGELVAVVGPRAPARPRCCIWWRAWSGRTPARSGSAAPAHGGADRVRRRHGEHRRSARRGLPAAAAAGLGLGTPQCRTRPDQRGTRSLRGGAGAGGRGPHGVRRPLSVGALRRPAPARGGRACLRRPARSGPAGRAVQRPGPAHGAAAAAAAPGVVDGPAAYRAAGHPQPLEAAFLADRVIVLDGRPARVRAEFTLDLPGPVPRGPADLRGAERDPRRPRLNRPSPTISRPIAPITRRKEPCPR